MTIKIIVAVDLQNAIGQEGGMPWHMPADLRRFRELTTGHPVIMGRRTFESLPNGALPDRVNIVITSKCEDEFPGCKVARTITEAVDMTEGYDSIFFIGGGQIYEYALQFADEIYLTQIDHIFPKADTFFPQVDPYEWDIVSVQPQSKDKENRYDYTFFKFERV